MIASPTVGVLALQGDFREHADALRQMGLDPVLVRRECEFVGLQGLIIPGGESTAMCTLLDAFDLWEPLRHRLDQGMAVYGSCAGMIMLATTVLDGRPEQPGLAQIDMVVRRNAFGRQTESFETDIDVVGLADPFRAVFIRAPWVESVGEGVEVLAALDIDGQSRPVAVRQGQALATSFHPEVTGDVRIHQLFVELACQAG